MTLASPRPPSPPKATPQQPPESLPPPTTLEPVQLIHGVEQYLQVLRESSDSLVVLKVFAPWCRSCRALTPKVNRFAREFSNVRFFKMDYEQNKELCHRLGVASMPTFVFYWGVAGEIEKFSCGPQRAYILREKIEQCLAGSCAIHPQ